jgi:L-fucose isomerase
MLANAGSLDQVGIKFYKTFGDIKDKATYEQVKSRLLAIAALSRLKGLTFGLFGGRSLGIDTAVADPALWMKQFGVDVDHVDQMELVRRAEAHVAKGTKVEPALKYLKTHVKKIHWTKPDAQFRLTEDLLKKQLGMYYAAWDLCQEYGYAFCGIKGQRELTEHYVTADVAEAFLNDPYHPDGTPKEPIICSTEADMDAALTMKIFNLLSGEPALFADVRHYHDDLGAWDLCNSGEHATFFAARSTDAPANLKHVEFRPEGFYFPAGGASVFHFAAPGEVTLARLTRSGDTNRYRMAIMTGQFITLGADKAEQRAKAVQDNWPHAYCKLDNCSLKTFIDGMNCNHIHAAYGRWLDELVTFCDAAGIEAAVLRD